MKLEHEILKYIGSEFYEIAGVLIRLNSDGETFDILKNRYGDLKSELPLRGLQDYTVWTCNNELGEET